ncbi:MAG: metal-dependent transcriptional regulator [Halodesulfurarchaeum sp.]
MATDSEPGTASTLPEALSDIERGPARYLFAMAVLSTADTDRVTTGALQDYLQVTPASVTEMVSKLDDRGLVEYEKYHGVTLTEAGEALATEAGWRFCVMSTFFESVLELQVTDQTAFDIGYVLPQDGVVRLREMVDSGCLGLCPPSVDDTDRCMA